MEENELHVLLQKQLAKFNIVGVTDPALRNFLLDVSATYVKFENEHNTLNETSENMLEKVGESNSDLRSIIQTLDNFNYQLSHDLKNSMINTLSLSKMLDKYVAKQDLDKTVEVVSQLSKNAEYGLKLIEKFLQVSKLNAKQAESRLEYVNIFDLIKDIKIELKEPSLNIQFERNEFEIVHVKRAGFHNLFKQLIMNAIQYQDKDRELEINIDLTYDNVNRKCISFADNGIGIDMAKNSKHIFKPFVPYINQFGQETTGVGLFLVKKIVTEHNGSINLTSELGTGTKIDMKF